MPAAPGPKKAYKLGSTCITGQKVASILGQSDRACVYITTDNHLRWEISPPGRTLKEHERQAVSRFDYIMAEIKSLSISANEKSAAYELLGKSLFGALDSKKARAPSIAFQDVEKLISSKKASRDALFDVAIVCALHDPEQKAVLSLSKWQTVPPLPSDPQTYRMSQWTSAGATPIRVVTAAPNHMGLVASTALAAKMTLRFRPRLIVIVGIAAGARSKTQGFGDILAPDNTFDYGSGKTKASKGKLEILASPNPLPVAPRILSRLKDWATKTEALSVIAGRWPAASPQTQLRLHIGPMFSGPTVLDAIGPIKDVMQHWRKLIGVEMEAHGVHRACNDTIDPPPQFLCLKSVSDFAEKKTDNWQHYAAFTSANFLKDFLEAEWTTLFP